jgi:hypothetical protein
VIMRAFRLRTRRVLERTGLALACAMVLGISGGAASAQAEAPSWKTQASFLPSVLLPGQAAHLELVISDLGDAGVSSSAAPVKFTDRLPAGVKATGVVLAYAGLFFSRGLISCEPALPATEFPASALTCTWQNSGEPLQPYESLYAEIDVEAEAGAALGRVENEVRVSGGEGYLCHPAAQPHTGNFDQANCDPREEGVANGEFEGHASGVPAAPASQKQAVTIGEGATPFGVENYRLALEEESGASLTEAGAHPYQLTTTVALNQGASIETPPAIVKDIASSWPAGLVGNPSPFPQCPEALFDESNTANNGGNNCPSDTAIGVAIVHAQLKSGFGGGPPFPWTTVVPLFNLPPAPGEPARAGFILEKTPVTFDAAVRTGRDYGVVVTSHNLTEVQGLGSATIVTWGTPGAASHDKSRGWQCINGGSDRTEASPLCGALGESQPPPFLSAPTSCTGSLQSTVAVDSWREPNNVIVAPLSEPISALSGCNRLPFSAKIAVAPDLQSASTSTGLTVKVSVPQEAGANANGLADADVRDTTVTLPEGVQLNPSAGDGLQACTGDPGALSAGQLASPGDEIGFKGEAEVDPGLRAMTFTERLPNPLSLEQGIEFCPDAAKIANVKIKTPLLPNELKGSVYLASQNANPFGTLLAMYLVAEDRVSGTLVKLPGEVRLSPTGQITTTFENTPQVPFESLELAFFGGERAPLATPSRCGSYTTQASFTPWSGNAPVKAESTFEITSGPDGKPCPGASLPFNPSLTGGTTNNNGGAFSPLSTTISRQDGEQSMQSVTLHMPPGVSGILSGVKLCPEAQANEGTCGPESQIGETTVSAGIGADPVAVKGGKVYLTEKYAGAPFGLSIVNPVKAGPFDLEHDTSKPSENMPSCDCIVVRGKIEVNPTTAALTVTTDPSGPHAIPHLIDGVPVQIKKVNVLINRPGFTFNATNCKAMQLTGSIGSDEGASSPVSVPFQDSNCARMPFEPTFTASTSAKTSKKDGASLHVSLTYPKGVLGQDTNLKYVKVELPKALPSELETLKKACLESVFNANPASCPAASVIGHAVVHTPVLPVPLQGPAYFVSHGGKEFPSLTIVLQGYGVSIELVGETYISKGVTSSTFSSTPDVPFESFELTLPEGEYSALAANGNLCNQKLVMPTSFIGQSGAALQQQTRIAVQGCAGGLKVLSKKIKGGKLTLRVVAPSAGTLKASGKGLTSASKSASGREPLSLVMHVGAGAGSHSKVKLAFKPTQGKRLSKTVPLSLQRA